MTRITISALALVLAAPMALAEGHSSTELKSIDMKEMEGALIRSRDITGGNIYTMDDATWDATAEYTEIDTDWVNIGEIENRGLELTLNTQNTTGAFEWRTGINFSVNRNEVISLGSNGNLIGLIQRILYVGISLWLIALSATFAKHSQS